MLTAIAMTRDPFSQPRPTTPTGYSTAHKATFHTLQLLKRHQNKERIQLPPQFPQTITADVDQSSITYQTSGFSVCLYSGFTFGEMFVSCVCVCKNKNQKEPLHVLCFNLGPRLLCFGNGQTTFAPFLTEHYTSSWRMAEIMKSSEQGRHNMQACLHSCHAGRMLNCLGTNLGIYSGRAGRRGQDVPNTACMAWLLSCSNNGSPFRIWFMRGGWRIFWECISEYKGSRFPLQSFICLSFLLCW